MILVPTMRAWYWISAHISRAPGLNSHSNVPIQTLDPRIPFLANATLNSYIIVGSFYFLGRKSSSPPFGNLTRAKGEPFLTACSAHLTASFLYRNFLGK